MANKKGYKIFSLYSASCGCGAAAWLSSHNSVSSRINNYSHTHPEKRHSNCPAWCELVCYLLPYATASTSDTPEASTSAWSSILTIATMVAAAVTHTHSHRSLKKQPEKKKREMCALSLTWKQPKQLLKVRGRRLYCCSSMDENELLLKHTLQSLWCCRTATSAHFNLNDVCEYSCVTLVPPCNPNRTAIH